MRVSGEWYCGPSVAERSEGDMELLVKKVVGLVIIGISNLVSCSLKLLEYVYGYTGNRTKSLQSRVMALFP